MKTYFEKHNVMMLFVAIMTAFTLTSCDKNEDDLTQVKEEIVGTWEVTSYKVGGDEYIGFAIESAALTFNAYTGDEGIFGQEVAFFDEDVLTIMGAYSVNEAKDEVKMNYDGDLITAKVRINENGQKLRWDGSQDGFPLVIHADRK